MTAGQTTGALAGKRVLIAEDEWLVAEAIEFAVEAAGGKVVGPFPTVVQALAMLTGYGPAPDAATLNIRLADGESYPIADQLESMNIPEEHRSVRGTVRTG